MKSIKPGRGPSAMGGIGSIFAALFGVIWTMVAVSMGAPWFFALFGIMFIIMALVQAAYNLKNATSEERFSAFDIVDSSEERDPAEQLIMKRKDQESRDPAGPDRSREEDISGIRHPEVQRRFCPYCGAAAAPDYRYCSSCGRELPERGKEEEFHG